MTSKEYLEKVTIGTPTEVSGRIVLEEYTPKWEEMFQAERKKMEHALKNKNIAVEHVGSTSVPGLCAKPIIDILLLVDDSTDEEAYVKPLEEAGYVLRIREPEWYDHRMLKGTNPEVNLHVFSRGCPEAERMISFRDWLRIHEDDRELYASAKRELSERKWKYVQEYADAKSEVVQQILTRINVGAGDKDIYGK